MNSVAMKKPAQAAIQIADPSTEWVTIDPDIAAEMLKCNTLNRPKKPQKIKLYAGDMVSGEWPTTGATIQFGASGRLLDGQNRLQAVIDSGASVRMLIVRGIDDDVFDKIDRGTNRTATDVLVIMGYEGWVAATGSSATQVAHNLLNGYMPFSSQITPAQVREFIEEHPALMRSVLFMEEMPRKVAPMNHSAAAALHWLMAAKSAEMADMYFERLFVGCDMQADDMVLKLRNRLLGREDGNTGKAMRTSGIGAVIKVWNALRSKRNIVHINNAFPRSDEPFPEIK